MNPFDALFKESRFYFGLFDHMEDSFYVCDTEKNLVYCNRTAEKLDKIKLSEVKGKPVTEIYNLDESRSPALRVLKTEMPIYNEKCTYYINGKEIVQLNSSEPIYMDGELVGCYTLQHNITPLQDIVEKNIQLQIAIAKEKNSHPPIQNTTNGFSKLIGESSAFRNCIAQAQKAAKTDSAIMLVGATGTGKEVFARAIHEASDRAAKPFLALNCAAIPETLIESILFGTTKGVYTGAVEKEGILSQAEGGTVFFDELNSMPLSAQSKLLRVLEEKKIMKLGGHHEKPINVRIISSTNESPKKIIQNHVLREDLYYRLSVVQITIPPLHQRRDDIPQLTNYFIEKYNKRFNKSVLGIDDNVYQYFMSFSWPGNVRQLKACIEAAMNFTKDQSKITLNELPRYIFDGNDGAEDPYWFSEYDPAPQNDSREEDPSLGRSSFSEKIPKPHDETIPLSELLRREEKDEILRALHQTKGNVSKAAKLLGIPRQTLQYRMKKHKIS